MRDQARSSTDTTHTMRGDVTALATVTELLAGGCDRDEAVRDLRTIVERLRDGLTAIDTAQRGSEARP